MNNHIIIYHAAPKIESPKANPIPKLDHVYGLIPINTSDQLVGRVEGVDIIEYLIIFCKLINSS
jgi:hypothetical protein